MGRQDLAQESFEEARRILVEKIKEAPDDARFHSSLGITLAGLSRSGEAVREGERGLALMPPTRDAFRGVFRVEDLARICAMVGNQEAAIEQLDYLLSHPSWISVPLLRLDPRWDPVRKNPKFEALLAKYEVELWSLAEALGEADAHFAWTEKAFAERVNGLAYARLGAADSPFRGDPRQRDLLGRVSGR